MGVAIDGIALCPPGFGTEFEWQLLRRCFGSALVRNYRLAGGTVRGLIRQVVGAGIVVVLHKLLNDGSQPRNPPALDLTSTPLSVCRIAA